MIKSISVLISVFSFLLGISQFQVNGNAFQQSDSCYRLTLAANSQSGSVWNISQVSLANDFEIFIDVYLGSNDGGADGIAFAFQQVSSSVGSLGGGLGISGISPSLFFEFDTYQNGWAGDLSGDHVALMKNGSVDHTSANNVVGPIATANLEDGAFHLAYIKWEYISTTQQNIKLYLDCNLLIDHTDNFINTVFNSNPNVFWGLTGSTGALNNLQQFCFRYISFLEPTLQDTVTCAGDSITLNAPPLGIEYNWYPNIGFNDTTLKNPTVLPTTTTTYYVDLINICNIPFTDSLTITVLDTNRTFIDTAICVGTSLFVGGANQFNAGTYYDTLFNTNNCDSIIVTNLSVLDTTNSFQTLSICIDDSLFIGGAYQTAGGTYMDTFVNSAGCDSFLYTNLVILPRTYATVNDTICKGQSLFVGGAYQTQTGAYNDTLVNSNNCDSVITTQLYVADTFYYSFEEYICFGDSFLIDGVYETTSGVYFENYTSQYGCDSIHRIQLYVLESTIFAVDTSICNGTSYFAQGEAQTTAGTYYDTLYYFNGCDSFITQTNLSIINLIEYEKDTTICMGDSIFLANAWQTETGSYIDTIKVANSCDEVLTTHLSLYELPTALIEAPDNFCIEDSVILETYTTGVRYYWIPSRETTSRIVAFKGGEFVLEITDINNCKDTDTTYIEAIEGCYDLFLPTGFSPNGDGVNDLFGPLLIPRVSYEMNIYNRWGELIYYSTDSTVGWDGSYKGIPQEIGTYTFDVSYKFKVHHPLKTLSGNLTLIR